MFDSTAALALLQYGDSAYPAGGFAFSWGIEGLAADGLLKGRADLERVVSDHLTFRWALMDRPLLHEAWQAADVAELVEVDRSAEAATPYAELRDGSRRAGRALLGISARLGRPLSVAYRTAASADALLGHLPVTQAVVYRDAGFTLAAAELLAGWTLITGLVSAATRLDIIGHLDAQASLAAGRATLAELIAEPPATGVRPSSFTPLIDIAMIRSSTREVRMFTT